MQQIIHGIGEKTEKGREEGKEAVLMLYTHTHSLVLYPAAWPLSHSHTHYDHCKIGFDLWPHTKMTASENRTQPRKWETGPAVRQAYTHTHTHSDSHQNKIWSSLIHIMPFLQTGTYRQRTQHSSTKHTLAALFSWYMDGSSAALPAAHLVALISSAKALATSLTAFISTTWKR